MTAATCLDCASSPHAQSDSQGTFGTLGLTTAHVKIQACLSHNNDQTRLEVMSLLACDHQSMCFERDFQSADFGLRKVLLRGTSREAGSFLSLPLAGRRA